MQVIKDFSDKALSQIRAWTWAAAVLPITALAGLFFVWAFGTEELYNKVIVAGAITMFATAAVWWWWIIWTVSKILKKDRIVVRNLNEAKEELKHIKRIVHETYNEKDK